MKTLILLVLYITLIECRLSPIEVFEIKETNERRPQLYVKNVNDLEELQDDDSPLAQIFRPLRKEKVSAVDRVTRNLLEKLKYLSQKNTERDNAKDVYIIDASLLQQTDVDDNFSDETRSESPALQQLLKQLLPLKQSRTYYKYPPVRSALRSVYEDRTAAPRHRHEYDIDI